MSAIVRNKELLKSILVDGLSYAECVKKYQLTGASSVSGAIRSIVDMLKEHTDIEVESNASYAYIVQQKEKLLHYLDKPMPKVTIVPAAKTYLNKKYGKYYASIPKQVAEDWDEITKVFTYYRHERERYSIQRWLASEGYLVGNFVDQEMLSVAHEAMIQQLEKLNFNKGDIKFEIKKIDIYSQSDKKASLVFEAELASGKHVTERRFRIELL